MASSAVYRLGIALLVLVAGAVWAASRTAGVEGQGGPLWIYVGTYTNGGSSKGIYRFDMDPATGNLTQRALAGEATDPSFLAIHPNHRFLYAVGEVDNFGGKKSGAVNAFAIDP